MEVRIRTTDDATAVHLGEVGLDAQSLGSVIRLLEMWGVRDGYGKEYSTNDITGQIVYEDGAAFFEIVLRNEEGDE